MHRRLTTLAPRGWRASCAMSSARWDDPYPIWAMTGGTFINMFGGSMVFPRFI